MQQSSNIGVIGLGAYLPTQVRTNEWWPSHVVEGWREKRAAGRAKHGGQMPSQLTEGMKRVLAAIEAMADDPFQGARERRVLEDHLLASDMEERAAREAIADAGVDPAEIDLVLCNTAVPDHLVTNNACLLHHRLGLPERCFTMATEAACNSFMMPLSIAQHMIAGGQAKTALIVQSCNVSRLLDLHEPASPWFGDGATAAIVTRVGEGHGILAQTHRTDGSINRTLVASVPGGRWYDEGRVRLYSADPQAARTNFLSICDLGKEVVDEVLQAGGARAEDVDFFAVHQGTPWLRRITLEHFGLTRARSIETFAWTGSLFGSNIPLGLVLAKREGQLKAGDLVLAFGGGAGTTCSSMLMRWGR